MSACVSEDSVVAEIFELKAIAEIKYFDKC